MRTIWVVLVLVLVLLGCGSRSISLGRRDGTGNPGADLPVAPHMDRRLVFPDVPFWKKDYRPVPPDAPITPRSCQSYCTSKADCGGGFADCVGGKCVVCKADADCPVGVKKCNTATGICTFCVMDSNCVISGTKILTGKCDLTSGQCLKCTMDADCTFAGSPFKLCNTAKGTCIQCKTDVDCSASPIFRRCDNPTGTCSLCLSDNECCQAAQKPPGCGLTCASTGRCVCTADAQCAPAFSTTMKWACK